MLVTPWFSGNRPRTLMDPVIPMPKLGTPNVFSLTAYEALMGLLCSSGANLARGPNCWHYPRSTILKLSSSDLGFLKWLISQFSDTLGWNPIRNSSITGASASITCLSHTSFFLYILRMHWYHEGLYFLPVHFEQYFSWITLAFWAMRSGQYSFLIGISRLNTVEQLPVLKDKLGLESHITMSGKKLSISDPELVVNKIRPHFHASQLHRLVRKA